jgi:hypothetical protein
MYNACHVNNERGMYYVCVCLCLILFGKKYVLRSLSSGLLGGHNIGQFNIPAGILNRPVVGVFLYLLSCH